MSIEQLLEDARNSPECFKCGEPITEFSDVRIVTVRVDDKPMSVWVHADHAKPGQATEKPPRHGCICPQTDSVTGEHRELRFYTDAEALEWLAHMTAAVERKQAHTVFNEGMSPWFEDDDGT